MKKTIILSLLLILVLSSFQFLNIKRKNNQFNQEIGVISDLVKEKWVIPFKYKRREVVLINETIYPSLKEYTNKAFDAKTGRPIYFNLIKNQKLFKKNKVDSIIVYETTGKITAINLYTGEVLYRKDRVSNFPIQKKAHTINDSLLFTVNKDTLFAYNLKRKSILWRFKTNSIIYDEVKIYKNELIVSDKINLYALSRNSGKILWQIPLGEFYTSPVIEDDKLFVIIKSKGAYSINLENQKIEWIYSNMSKYPKGQLQFILNDNVLYYYSDKLYAIDKTTGLLKWKNDKLNTRPLVSFVIINDYIVSYNYDTEYEKHSIICNKNTGEILYKESPVNKNKTDYTFKNSTFYFVDEVYENNFYAYTSDSLYCFEILK